MSGSGRSRRVAVARRAAVGVSAFFVVAWLALCVAFLVSGKPVGLVFLLPAAFHVWFAFYRLRNPVTTPANPDFPADSPRL